MRRRHQRYAPALAWPSAALLTTAVLLSGCHPKQLHGQFGIHVDDHDNSFSFAKKSATAPSTLTCPSKVDELSRTAQATNGQSCAYVGPNGQTVQVSLMPLDGQTPQTRLAALEQTLKGQLGPISQTSAVRISADSDHDRANIDLPGFHLHANGDGQADIQMPGVNIAANGETAQVHAGWGAHQAVVNADSSGAEVRAGSVNGGVADLSYVLASSMPGPTGLRAAGYLARGPAAGPLVVGVFRSAERDHGHELNDSGLQRLIRMNTGAG